MEKTNKNVETNPNTETIGDFINKHTADTDNFDVKLHWHVEKYLNEEDSDKFLTLIECTTGFDVSVDFEKGNVVVYDGNGKFYTSYDYDCPVVDVYTILLAKMSADVKSVLHSVEEQYAKNKELRIWGFDNPRTYNALAYFAQDLGIEVKIGEENNKPYIDIIGINE